MTGKLIKYEFKSIMKIMGIVWAALLASSLLTGISNSGFVSNIAESGEIGVINIFSSLSTFIYGGTVMALVAVTIVVIIARFYKGLLGDEGYLMHTLPVKTWQLITAKGVTAAIVSLLSIAAGVVSGIIIGSFFDIWEMGDFARGFFRLLGDNPQYILIGVELFVFAIVAIMSTVYKVYASMAIGQLAQKNRILFSVLAYMGIGALGTALGTIFLSVSGDAFGSIFESVSNWMMDKEIHEITQLAFLMAIVFEFIKLAIFHVVTERILTKRLNLE